MPLLVLRTQVVATASGDKTIRVWSLKDATCLRTLEGHTAAVLALAFSSAGTQVLSTGSDATLKLWSLKTSECLNTFDNHEDKVRARAGVRNPNPNPNPNSAPGAAFSFVRNGHYCM